MGFIRNIINFAKNKFQQYRSFILFLIIGGIGTIINAGFVYLFVDVFHFYFMFGAILSLIIALTSNYTMNRIWTFPNSPENFFFRGLLKYYIASSIGSIINLICLFILVQFMNIWIIFGVIISTSISALWNYFSNKKWTFQEVK